MRIKLVGWMAILMLAAGATGLGGCETVPVTGRSQLALVPEEQLLGLAEEQYQTLLRRSELSADEARVGMLRRVGEKIRAASEEILAERTRGEEIDRYQWEYNLIQDDKTVNAFALPGGKVAVYSGLLPVTEDETGLAVVVGHEVAHILARHGQERMSQQLLVQLGGMALETALQQKPVETRRIFQAVYGIGAEVGVMMPFSRSQESEADHIGLILMAKAGYDPARAVAFWRRMQRQSGAEPPEFLSTHPANERRIEELQEKLPEAEKYYRK